MDIYKVGQNFSVPANETADWVVNVTLALRSAPAFSSPSISLAFAELNLTSPAFPVDSLPTTIDSPSWVTVLWHIPDSIPQRWYPHNLGTPQLYNLTITLDLADSAEDVQLTVRTGFRTVKLAQLPYLQEEVDARGITPGDQWHFEDQRESVLQLGDEHHSARRVLSADYAGEGPLGARKRGTQRAEHGAHHSSTILIQSSNLQRSAAHLGWRRLPARLRSRGIQSILPVRRAWILAWSEFVFSDALYPLNDFLLESIEPEVRQNIRRINKHPSNIQWAAGNEIEVIMLLFNSTFGGTQVYVVR